MYNQLCALSFCLVDLAFASGLRRSVEETMVVDGLRRRRNDANS